MFQFFETNSLTRKAKLNARANSGCVEIKSKFNAEFRRFSIDISNPPSLEQFQAIIINLHHLTKTPFCLTYTDKEGDLLPINNHDNFTHALRVSKPLLRICVQHANNSFQSQGYGGALPKKNLISRMLEPEAPTMRSHKRIGMPEDFRYVSAIIDVDILPPTQRRVKLIRDNTQKPLGFFVRDGFSIHPTASGSLERVAGVFISRLVPGGLADGTGLLAANDEVLEVNGIEVAGKTLDQVTDMMVANSGYLIITIKPCNQYTKVTLPHATIPPPPLITSSFNDLSRTNSSGRQKKMDLKSSCSMHDLKMDKNAGEIEEEENNGGMRVDVIRNSGVKEEDEDDVMEFVRRDPSGSSASNRDSAQLMHQQQQQLLQLKELTLQKQQLEDQLKLQQLHQQQQQYNSQEFSSPDPQLIIHQQQLLQQYELQQQLKQNDITSFDLPQQNQQFNNYDIINNNVNNNDTTKIHSIYPTKSPNISTNMNDNNWFNNNNNNNTQLSQQNKINIHNQSNEYINHQNLHNDQANNNLPYSQYDTNHHHNSSNNYHISSLKHLKNPSNNTNSFQKFSKNVMIRDLQSLDQLDKSCYDEENIRFVEGGDYDQADIFTNSSLRIAPASNRRNRQSSRSVDHHMKKRKDRF